MRYDYQQAFGAADKTTAAMKQAIREWFGLYYQQEKSESSDPCQRIAYTVVNKLVKTAFCEYRVTVADPLLQQAVKALDAVKKEAMQLALVGGECYIKPCPEKAGFSFTLIPRDQVLIFGRNAQGQPVDIGTGECSTDGQYYYTLLERRIVDKEGFLTIENSLYRASAPDSLGQRMPLDTHPAYRTLPERYTYAVPVGSVGLARMKTPMLNCVDGSADGVAVYAAAAGLIRNIDRNEAQMNGEFSRGESRIIASKDLLKDGALTDHLFVGLDEDPETVGITVFSPQLREQSYLARKQEYLRNVESVIGLKRGLLSEVNAEQRTATEVSASQGEHNLTVIDFQQMWEQALGETLRLCAVLASVYGMGSCESRDFTVDWGNGVLYDEEKLWQGYLDMVSAGLLKPELALAWRFNLPADTEAQRAEIRRRFLPETKQTDTE